MAAAPGDEDDTPVEPADTDSGGVPDEVTSDERTWAVLVHASALAGFVVPFGNILGPVLVWAIKRDESQFVDENGKEAVNFQITWTFLLIAAVLTLLVGIGLFLLPLVALAWLVLVVVAVLKASEDQVYDYPLTLDLIS